MYLPKIPEPSEDDLGEAMWWIRNYRDGAYADVQTRVIAHLLRHGSVLAKSLKELVYSAATPEEQAAITFFEKFGGEA